MKIYWIERADDYPNGCIKVTPESNQEIFQIGQLHEIMKANCFDQNSCRAFRNRKTDLYTFSSGKGESCATQEMSSNRLNVPVKGVKLVAKLNLDHSHRETQNESHYIKERLKKNILDFCSITFAPAPAPSL